MFRIGEFAQIAQVSGRLLRYYDQLGLLRPQFTDASSGYRYYSAQQLPRLNRILALKSLGLTLDQVARMVDDDVPVEEMRGMLSIRKAQIEQSLAEDQARLREIESRILQIEEQGAFQSDDVVVKALPAQPFLAVRRRHGGMDEAIRLLRAVATAGAVKLRAGLRDKLIVVAHSDFTEDEIDLEIGFSLTALTNRSVRLPGEIELRVRELEAAPTMATIVRTGPHYQSHLAYGTLGLWMEANGYRIDGLCREVFHELPFADPAKEDLVVEIQFPVQKAA